jgi:hypothetical protein
MFILHAYKLFIENVDIVVMYGHMISFAYLQWLINIVERK